MCAHTSFKEFSLSHTKVYAPSNIRQRFSRPKLINAGLASVHLSMSLSYRYIKMKYWSVIEFQHTARVSVVRFLYWARNLNKVTSVHCTKIEFQLWISRMPKLNCHWQFSFLNITLLLTIQSYICSNVRLNRYYIKQVTQKYIS